MTRKTKSPFRRVDTPRNVSRVIPIIKIGATEVLVCAVCSPRPWGYATHWNGERTVHCTAQTGKCEYCNPAFSTRDKGLVLVCNTMGQLRGFLELTPLAFDQAVRMGTDLGGLRGKVIQVRRENGTKKGRLLIEYVSEYQAEIPLPMDRDPEPTLRRIHGLPDID